MLHDTRYLWYPIGIQPPRVVLQTLTKIFQWCGETGELHTLLINCGELSLTFLFLQWKKRGLEGEEDSLEEISRGRKGENLGQILVLAAQLGFAEKVFNFLKTKKFVTPYCNSDHL